VRGESEGVEGLAVCEVEGGGCVEGFEGFVVDLFADVERGHGWAGLDVVGFGGVGYDSVFQVGVALFGGFVEGVSSYEDAEVAVCVLPYLGAEFGWEL
jgi:hypothetical protein